MPGNVDLLLGADIFSHMVFHSRRFGPSDSLSTFKMQFGLVLAGAVHLRHTSQDSTNLCYMSTIMKEDLRVDDVLKKFWEIEDHNVEQPALSIDEHTVVEHFNRTQ